MNASRELLELAEFMGLTHVIASGRLPLEPVGQAEQREQPLVSRKKANSTIRPH